MFNAIRMGLSTGYLIGFSLAIFLNFKVILWIALSLISLITYSILVFKTRKKEQFFLCYAKHEEEDNKKENTDYNSNNQ